VTNVPRPAPWASRIASPRVWVPWAVAALGLAAVVTLLIAELVLVGPVPDLIFAPILMVLSSDLLIVGALIASRRPENPIGLLLLVSGLLAVVGFGGGPTGDIAEKFGGEIAPLLTFVAWIGNWGATVLLFLLVVILPLIYPNGRLISHRWVPAAVAAVGVMVAGTLRDAFRPGPMASSDIAIVNPFGVGEPVASWLITAGSIADALGPLALGLGVISLIVRFRRSTGIERAQLKWFVLVASIAGGALITGVVSPVPTIGQAGWIVGLASLAAMPIVIGLAVVRYRLFEIDRVISRTVAYTLLTVALAAIYLTGFAIAQGLLAPFTSTGGPLAVAASTLIVFAVFQPLRRRLQSAMDRRFNRSRYDAQLTVAAFAANLRDEVDLERLAGQLRATVGHSLAPTSMGVWLRPARTVER
jgi:hypothetical protein